MSDVAGGKSNSPHRQSLTKRFFLSPLGIFYRIWTFTVRMQYQDAEEKMIIEHHQGPVIIMLWHNRLFLAGEWHLRFRKGKTCYGLISGSRDGAWLETFYGWAGIRAIRGSRNRRGAQSMRDLVKVVKQGNDAGITPDGSRGPCYEAKPGVIALAKITKSPVLLLTFKFSSAFRLSSWDRFVIPFPFSKVFAKTKLIEYDDLFKNRSLEEATRVAQSDLIDLTED
jgi:lysophospholipid acyltransferase (LPLAT)-like uncharacterized protein